MYCNKQIGVRRLRCANPLDSISNSNDHNSHVDLWHDHSNDSTHTETTTTTTTTTSHSSLWNDLVQFKASQWGSPSPYPQV